MQITAAVMHAQGLPTPYAESRPFVIEQVDLEGPGDDEVLVEVRAAGLCHSDLSQVAGLRKRMLPVVGGHEGAGIVREVGKNVAQLRPGDHVVMTSASGCGHCTYCAESRPVLCVDKLPALSRGVLPNGARRLRYKGEPLFHYSGISSFAEYAVVLPNALIKIDPSVPLDVAAMFGCAVLTGAGSVFNAARLRPGQSVAVFGLGGVGLCAVMAAKLAGASAIVGVDINPAKFDLARELGCTHTLSPTDPQFVEVVKEATKGGVHYALEVSGARSAMKGAMAITRRGGEIIGVGLGGSTDMYEYAHTPLVLEEKAIRGSFMGSGNTLHDIPLYIEFYMRGKMPVDRLKNGTMSFGDLNQSLDLLDRGEIVRKVLLPHGA
ncbi:alcohol dehydrogenase [Sinorhizobium medicae]|nr:alcohol dehydrogenase [Sinorhizobium medicae]